jgi:hypothetical protein
VDKVLLNKAVPAKIRMELVRVTRQNLGRVGAAPQGLGLQRHSRGLLEAALSVRGPRNDGRRAVASLPR